MAHTPPPSHHGAPHRRNRPSAAWFVLGGLVLAIILYFLFFTGTPEDATVTGTGAEVTVEPADEPATPAN